MERDKIRYQLLNYEKNKKMLAMVPHIPYLDLAIVFYSILEEKEGSPYGIVTWNGMKKLKLGLEELEVLAAENTARDMPCQLEALEKMLERITGHPAPENVGGVPMYVLTNQQHIFGASCILYPNLLYSISEYFQTDLYILPSSIHECILIPEGPDVSRKKLADIVADINSTEVPEEEVLSNCVYVYKQEGDVIYF